MTKAKTKTKAPKRISGGKQMKRAGKVLVQAQVDKKEHQTIRAAAGIAGKSINRFLIDAGVTAAKRLFKSRGLTL